MYKTEREQRAEFQRRLIVLLMVVGFLLVVGTVFYHFSEGWAWHDSLYFATISLTSRGFSDLYPSNWYSVIFSVFYLFIGLALLIFTLSSFIAYYSAFYQSRVESGVGKMVKKIREKKKKQDKWVMLKMKK